MQFRGICVGGLLNSRSFRLASLCLRAMAGPVLEVGPIKLPFSAVDAIPRKFP